jgi:lipoprotein-releasing system permease protein
MKDLKLEFKIALKYLTSKRKEGFASLVSILSFLGIMLGVATLIVVMAVMNGVKSELIKRIIGINSHISISSVNQEISNFDELVKDIKTINGVTSVYPAFHGQVLATVNGVNRGLMVRGMRLEDFKSKKILADSLKVGKFFSDDEFNLIAGIQLAKQTGINLTTKISLISPNFNATMFGSIPRMKEFAVSGIFDVGMYEYDSGILFTSLKNAQRFFGKIDKANII